MNDDNIIICNSCAENVPLDATPAIILYWHSAFKGRLNSYFLKNKNKKKIDSEIITTKILPSSPEDLRASRKSLHMEDYVNILLFPPRDEMLIYFHLPKNGLYTGLHARTYSIPKPPQEE